jgi:hypothetical protein
MCAMAELVKELTYTDGNLNAYTGAEAAEKLIALLEDARWDGKGFQTSKANKLIAALAKSVERLLVLEKQRARDAAAGG